MTSAAAVFSNDAAGEWTLERITRLTKQEIQQLKDNAERLNEAAVAQLCSQALKDRPRARTQTARRASPRTHARRLIARTLAFEARGVYLADRRTSWGGVRKSDGQIVVALWAANVVSADGACRYLLWAPNVDGKHPWSDTAAGRERLDHCKRALELGRAEGLLVYGVALDGHIPEYKARSVHGADAETVVALQVERDGELYWAVWGRKAAGAI